MTQEIVQIAENVWLWPHHPDPEVVQGSVGIIVGGDRSVLVDTGNSPSLARRIKGELRRLGLPPVNRIIYTHHHWDHVSGGCEFEVPVVAHTACRRLLVEEARKPWSSDYLRSEVKRNPKLRVSFKARERAIGDWETFRIVVPDVVFDTNATISLDQVTIELEHVGGQHAEDSIVVRVPEARVMFLGDCFYPPPLHLRTPESTLSVPMLASLVDRAYDLYVDSHSEPCTRAEILSFLETC